MSQKFTYAAALALVLSVLVLLVMVVEGDGQTRRRKRPVRKPVVRKQIVPMPSDAIIMGRASDYDAEAADNAAALTEGTGTGAEPSDRDRSLADIADRIQKLERGMKNGYDEKQKRLLLNLDILTRAEQRSESLRKQRFEMVEKENSIRTKLDQIENDIRPEVIERSVAFAGSLRPEELRDARRKSLDAERRNLQALLTEIQNTRGSLEQSVRKADDLVERLRTKLEKDIDSALVEDKPEP